MAGFLFIALSVATIAWWIKKSSRAELIGWGSALLVIVALVLLGARYRTVNQAIESAFEAYMRFAFWCLAALLPAALSIVFFRWVSDAAPFFLQVIVFLISAGLLAAGIFTIAAEAGRERFFHFLATRVGLFAPIAYSFSLLIFATAFFSSVTYQLHRHADDSKYWLTRTAPATDADSQAALTPTAATTREELTSGDIADFYLWHFMKAIPLLEVTETLQWREPLYYRSGLVGLLLLIFKAVVIVPVIGAFAAYGLGVGRARAAETKPA